MSRYDPGVAGDAPLDLQAAADRLGVHYQTAYRWVRNGKLPADLVDGRYVVAPSAIDALTAARTTPRQPPAPGPTRRRRAAERMHVALADGDEGAARVLARTLVDEGTTIVELIQDVLVPPLVRIGTDWHEGRLTIWVEHRASAIVERILGELSPNPRGRRRGTVVVAAVSGDHHSLPTLMATVALRSDNWHVEHLGADMPPDELVRFCADHDVTLAVLSSTNPTTADLAAATAERLRAAGTPVIVGGPGATLDGLLDDARRIARGG
jgi:MerR family transcriptional regulator, light-induced transcriptional regulator